MPVADSAFVRACRCQPVDRVPVWFMRQAGRSLPEYRAARGEGSVLDAIRQPELAAELTLQPVRRYGVDAAILFSDIVVPVAAVGFGVEVEQGRGPVVDRPFRSAEDLARLRPLEPEADTGYVLEAVRLVTRELDPLGIPLIGFAGAPFTVASYLVEGGPVSRLRPHQGAHAGGTRRCSPGCSTPWPTWRWRRCGPRSQAGASAVQLFDSWVGALSPADYDRHVLPGHPQGLRGVGRPRACLASTSAWGPASSWP